MQHAPLDIPRIVLAPMAGGPSTVELAAAVCEAGGLGFLAAGYVSATDMVAQVERLRSVTDAPFGVNVFVIREHAVDAAALADYLRSLEADARLLGVAVGAARFDDDGFEAKVDALVRARVPVVSFTFACPGSETVAALQAVGTQVWVTVTSPEEADLAIAAGCDAVITQGSEAGGHRSSFHDDGGQQALATLALVHELAGRVSVPIIAAGGIATSTDVEEAVAAGAAAVQCGTAFLLSEEAGTHPVHRAAIASDAATAFTRAYTGRTARGVVTDFMRDHADAPCAFPHIHYATAPLRAAARDAGDAHRVNLWAGTRHAVARQGAAAAIVRSLMGDT